MKITCYNFNLKCFSELLLQVTLQFGLQSSVQRDKEKKINKVRSLKKKNTPVDEKLHILLIYWFRLDLFSQKK